MNRYYVVWTCKSSKDEVTETLFYYKLDVSALRVQFKKDKIKWSLRNFFDNDRIFAAAIDAKNQSVLKKMIKDNFNKVKFKIISKKDDDYVIDINKPGDLIALIRRKKKDDYIKDRLNAI